MPRNTNQRAIRTASLEWDAANSRVVLRNHPFAVVDGDFILGANALDLDDNGKVVLGSGDDGEIFFDGTDLQIKTVVGNAKVVIDPAGTGGVEAIQASTATSIESINTSFKVFNSNATASNLAAFLLRSENEASNHQGIIYTQDEELKISAGSAAFGTPVVRIGAAAAGFFGTAPASQPASGSTGEAAFVENSGGTAVNVDSTFGGYTLQQVVQGLQDLGLFA